MAYKSGDAGAELNRDIEGMIAKIAETGASDLFKKWMQFLADGNYLSWGNMLWCYFQDKEITNVRSYRKWGKVKRHVVKGAKGLKVLFPKKITVRFDINDNRIAWDDKTTPVARVGSYLSFGVGYVFDVRFTEGEPLPEIAWYSIVEDDSIFAKLAAFCQAKSITLEIEDNGGMARGYSAGGKIGLKTKAVKTLIHEIAHELLHWREGDRPESRTVREIEAEMVAYIICKRLGIDVSDTSAVYLANWGADAKAIRQSTGRIERAVSEISEFIFSDDTESE